MDLYNESDDLTWVPVNVNLESSFKFPLLLNGNKTIGVGGKMNYDMTI